MQKFKDWYSLKENKRNEKTQTKMPDGPAKERRAGGRRNTAFDSRPKRLRTKADQNRDAFENQ